ncbi:putative Ent-kaurene oxidase [Xylaria grammica]|nr:putative Ent-kaurene oxidase [Xylaria grammica]
MQSRDMGHLALITAEEINKAFLISCLFQRILFGLPLSRDEALLETSRNYATSLLVGGAIINCFPPLVRWLAGPIVALRAKYFQSRFVKVLEPVAEERIRQWEADEDGGPGPSQLDARRIAPRLVSLLIPLIFAICYVFARCVFDILGSPARLDVLAGLEEECTRVFAQHTTGLASSEAINELFRVDSALRESMRMSGVSLDVGNGIRVGPGIRMTFPTQNIHLDPDDYENPQEYDALRFSRPFADAKGRFAAQVIKQALAYIVQNYNVELVGEAVKRIALVNVMVPPVNTQIKIQQKK